jgi:hypothetical protein
MAAAKETLMVDNPTRLDLKTTKAVSITGPTNQLPQINVYPAQFFLVGQNDKGVLTILGQVTIQKWDNFGVPDPADHNRFFTHSFNIPVVLQAAIYNIGFDPTEQNEPIVEQGTTSIYMANADGTLAGLGYVNQHGLVAHEAGA